MSERLQRLIAIVRADFLIRLRRPSTVVVFLLLSAIAYLWVPAPSTGRALMQIKDQRVLYNSASIAMATANIASRSTSRRSSAASCSTASARTRITGRYRTASRWGS